MHHGLEYQLCDGARVLRTILMERRRVRPVQATEATPKLVTLEHDVVP